MSGELSELELSRCVQDRLKAHIMDRLYSKKADYSNRIFLIDQIVVLVSYTLSIMHDSMVDRPPLGRCNNSAAQGGALSNHVRNVDPSRISR